MGHIVTVDYPKYVTPNTRFRVIVKVINDGTESARFKVILTDVNTGTFLGSLGGLISPNVTGGLGFFVTMPDRNLTLQARLDSEDVVLDSKTFTVYPKGEEPEPKPVSLLPLIVVAFIVILMFIWMAKKT